MNIIIYSIDDIANSHKQRQKQKQRQQDANQKEVKKRRINMKPLSLKQRWFIAFCRYVLAAQLFKCYWFVGGSIWNKSHVRKNSSSDLQGIIDDSWSYTNTHLQAGFLGVLVLAIYSLFGTIEREKILGVWVVLMVTNGYPLCIHAYNRILADQLLLDLKEHPEKEFYATTTYSQTNSPITRDKCTSTQWLALRACGDKGFDYFDSMDAQKDADDKAKADETYKLEDRCYARVGPLFANRYLAADFRAFLYLCFADEAAYSQATFLDSNIVVAKYREWLPQTKIKF
jgi:hypothetical protein